MFERERFSGLPGGALAAELEAVDPFALDDDDLASYLQAVSRLEAWTGSLKARGIYAFADGHTVAEEEGDKTTGGADRRQTLPGLQRTAQFGAEGTPLVEEFAADELAPLVQVAPMTAGHLLGDTLDLWFRLPWVRTGLRDGSVSWSAARAIAAGTRGLSQEQLDRARVDERLYRSATRLTPGQLRARIASVVAEADPESVKEKAKDKQRKLYVGFAPQPHQQTTSIFGELDPVGAQRLDAQVSAVAHLLRRLDTESPWEALRARGITLLADPAALRRVKAKVAALDSDSDEPGTGDGAADAAGEPRLSTTVVHVHADTRTWQSGDGLVEVEGYGWVPLWSLADMLAETDVRIASSTADLSHGARPSGGREGACREDGADPGYRPREGTRDTVEGRDRTCRFPGCNRRARACQCDHTIPWPHGPTCPCNLGSLCTRHHRLKTHADWSLRQPWPGVFLWRDPAGRYYLVDHTGTTRLDADAHAA